MRSTVILAREPVYNNRVPTKCPRCSGIRVRAAVVQLKGHYGEP